jgi:hypothetical protein
MFPVMSSARRRCWPLLFAGAALVVTGGCSKHRTPTLAIPSASPSATSSPAATFDPADPVQAFLGWNHALNVAQSTLDPNYPDLARYGQGPALAGVRSRIAQFKAQGIRQGKPTAAVGAHVSGNAVVKGKQVRDITACLIEPADDFVDIKTGKPRAPSGGNQSKPVVSKYVGTVVQGDDGGWRLDGGTLNDVPSCAAVR